MIHLVFFIKITVPALWKMNFGVQIGFCSQEEQLEGFWNNLTQW